MVDRNPNWNLVKIYADEGISGTSLQHREAFKQMVQDCEDGKIDLILTKVYLDLLVMLWTVSVMSGSSFLSVLRSVYF